MLFVPKYVPFVRNWCSGKDGGVEWIWLNLARDVFIIIIIGSFAGVILVMREMS